MTVDGDFLSSNNSQNNHACRNDLYSFIGMCDPDNVEPHDISKADSQNSFVIGADPSIQNLLE